MLEETGQWLENVDCTRLVLASGKLVLQKEHVWFFKPLLVRFRTVGREKQKN